MTALLAAFFSSFLFGLGLGISGMTLPRKVVGFLDVFGAWDPSLLAVMMGAVAVHSITYRLIARRSSPVLAAEFQIPTRRAIDWKLIFGSTLFGVGWGLGGFCPGPALVGSVTGDHTVLTFVASMVGGVALHQVLLKALEKRRVKAK